MPTAPILLSVLGLTLIAVPAQAQSTAPLYGKSPKLTPTEVAATAMSKEWRAEPAIMANGDDGAVMFLYGQSQPRVVCAPLQVCDIGLQPGERVLDVNVGDTIRWSVTPAKSGQPPLETVHLIVKPFEVGLSTSIAVTTDRRVYHIALISHRSEYMARVGFRYGDADNSAITAAFLANNPTLPPPVDPVAQGRSGDGLDFNYKLRGKARWKPLRVYNDGLKTYIDMPDAMSVTEAPALLVIAPGGEEKLVNYRIAGSRYIVDQIFDKAVLVAGVGRSKNRITVERQS